jgi:hypothetical protein
MSTSVVKIGSDHQCVVRKKHAGCNQPELTNYTPLSENCACHTVSCIMRHNREACLLHLAALTYCLTAYRRLIVSVLTYFNLRLNVHGNLDVIYCKN